MGYEMSQQEAKDWCIELWEHIAMKITDPGWREKAKQYTYWDDIDEDAFKKLALHDLFQKEWDTEVWMAWPNSNCFLCEYCRIQSYAEWKGCVDCPLSYGEEAVAYEPSPCCKTRRPFNAFVNNVAKYKWDRAAKSAQRLADQVKEWEVD